MLHNLNHPKVMIWPIHSMYDKTMHKDGCFKFCGEAVANFLFVLKLLLRGFRLHNLPIPSPPSSTCCHHIINSSVTTVADESCNSKTSKWEWFLPTISFTSKMSFFQHPRHGEGSYREDRHQHHRPNRMFPKKVPNSSLFRLFSNVCCSCRDLERKARK